MTVADSKWVYKNKDQGMMSTVGSLGALLLWGIDEGLTQIDKYQWSTDNNLKAGALLAFGLVTCGVKNECDPAWALLGEQLEAEERGGSREFLGVRGADPQLRLAAVVGLGYAYAGSCREACSIECSAMAAVSLGLVFVSSCNDEVAQAILQTLIERQAVENALSGTWPHFFAVGLGLLYLGQQDAAEATLSALDAITHPMGKYAKLTVEGLAFAYSGDVLHVQKMLQACTDHLEESESFHQAAAVLGIALIAFGEECGAEMACRSIDHILQYGEITLRRAVPLALAILHLSNPKVLVIDTLSKLSHDADQDVATGAIMSMGLIGAGTNNARLAGLLRQLAAYYAKDPNALFMVRIAQGLLYMGKGLLTINPLFSDRFLVDPVAFGSLTVLAHSVLHLKNTILGKSHYLLYHVVPAMRPRWLITVDEDMNELKVPVRVGQAVDVTGMAGRPKQITGFQTRTTPVLLNFQDRAELATEEYLPVTPGTILEDFVILKKNPNYKPATAGFDGIVGIVGLYHVMAQCLRQFNRIGQRQSPAVRDLERLRPIRVYCRFRAQNEAEEYRGGQEAWEFSGSPLSCVQQAPSTATLGALPNYIFDRVFGPEASQQDVYETVDPVVQEVLSGGGNGCILCYGQTSAGKTFTVEGCEGELRGIIPRTLEA
ncbi:unnamed protein product, partial [Effrenium voratum]